MPDWQRAFDDPIPLPRGRQIVTLRDAAEYITKLSKAEHDTAPWQAAMEALLLGRGAWRPDHVRADRRHAGIEQTRRASVRSFAEGYPLGTAQT